MANRFVAKFPIKSIRLLIELINIQLNVTCTIRYSPMMNLVHQLLSKTLVPEIFFHHQSVYNHVATWHEDRHWRGDLDCRLNQP